MATYIIEIPDAVAEWILAEKNIQAKTYIQNEAVNPIIKEYERTLRKGKIEAAELEVTNEVERIKHTMKIKDSSKVK